MKNRAAFYLVRGIAATIGFILSPLSWWNDLVVNVPLAYGIAWLAARGLNVFMTVHAWLFVYLFVAGYFFTNLAGFLLLHYSIFGWKQGKKGSLSRQFAVSLAYTILILAFFGLGICDPRKACPLIPAFVAP